MSLLIKLLLGLFVLTSFSTYLLADGDWDSCEGDGKTSTKSVDMQTDLLSDTILKG